MQVDVVLLAVDHVTHDVHATAHGETAAIVKVDACAQAGVGGVGDGVVGNGDTIHQYEFATVAQINGSSFGVVGNDVAVAYGAVVLHNHSAAVAYADQGSYYRISAKAAVAVNDHVVHGEMGLSCDIGEDGSIVMNYAVPFVVNTRVLTWMVKTVIVSSPIGIRIMVGIGACARVTV